MLVIALPIPIIGNNFAAFYKNERRREQLKEKKAALERARRKGAITPFPGQNGFAIEGAFEDGYDGEASVGEEGRSPNLNVSNRYAKSSLSLKFVLLFSKEEESQAY